MSSTLPKKQTIQQQNDPATSKAASSKTRRSAWDPYAPLPPSIKRKLDPKDVVKTQPYLDSLKIPTQVAEERLSGKLLQLDPPEGKVSDQRKAELAVIEKEKEKKRTKRFREGDCGLMGKRKRASRGKDAAGSVNYAAVLPVHHLWLGYMAELLALPIEIPSAPSSPSAAATLSATSIPLPTFPSRTEPFPAAAKALSINVVTIQTKLVKAEFVGCILSVKRAKNPSLVGLQGIVLQETQGTFKIVTPKSQVKVLPKQNSIFTIVLPLDPKKAQQAQQELSFDIYGDSFAYRSAERVGRKWKAGTGAGGVELI
ncbi:RNase P/RNase MRP complex subunit [Sporobolomyces salmoneus]|uniref:RNase P/RNase MRP complex subunit n=1 Tax=Sporobolomyces salmoneus TaxID=183962 RepID=UPI00316B48A5